MAIFRPSAILGAVSGSLGSVTFKNTRHGPVIARRLRRTKSPSSHLLQQRARFARTLLAWRELTAVQRAAWNSFARTLTRADLLGLPRTPTGRQIFLSHNIPALQLELPIVQDPPPRTQLPGITSLNILFDWTDPPHRWYPTVTSPLDPVYLITQACLIARTLDFPAWPSDPPTPTSPFNNWRFLQFDSVSPGTPAVWYGAAFIARFGYPPKGKTFAFRASIWHPDALRSPSFIVPGLCIM